MNLEEDSKAFAFWQHYYKKHSCLLTGNTNEIESKETKYHTSYHNQINDFV